MDDLQATTRPYSRLVTPTTLVEHPRYPVMDCHNHLGHYGGYWDRRSCSELLEQFDAAGVRLYVDLDGGWGEQFLCDHLDRFKAPAPDRFCMFGGVDWAAWQDRGNGFPEWAAARLRAQAAFGAQGLKVWKNLGLHVRDQHGTRVAVDDQRLDPIWETAAEQHLPVLIHTADPVAFFDPLDETNERWQELHARPEWHFPAPQFPSFQTLVDALANLVARHPRTTFIGAHVGAYAENLAWVAGLLDRCPNFYIDIAERIAELGRQPYSARRFMLRYADRILFGLDRGPLVNVYRIYYRFLETQDEYFSYDPDPSRQGHWHIYGLGLPDDVLARIYYGNAERVILHRQTGGAPCDTASKRE